jgi:hypothetical protein
VALLHAVKRWAKKPAKRLRRIALPDYEHLLHEVALLRHDLTTLQERLASDVGPRLHYLDEGLIEARRLNVRIAELTDLVTEVVLPLHHRDIDASRFDALPPETL